MTNLNLELVDVIKKENMKREVYMICGYKVRVDYVAGVFDGLRITNMHDRFSDTPERFMPDICYDECIFGSRQPELRIQTTA